MNEIKQKNTELSEAINNCFNYLFAKTETTTTDKLPIFKFLNNINNGNSPYIHKYPYHLILKLTSKCNLRCKHCFFSDKPESYNEQNDLSKEEMFNHIKYLVEEINIISCTITGGEIFTSEYFFEILEYLKSKNVIVELLTNGTLITEEVSRKLSNILNHKTDCIHVSLEGATEEVNDEIMGKGVFKKVIQHIKNLTSVGIKVKLSFTLNSQNTYQLETLYDLSEELKISQIDIGKFLLFNDSQKYLEPKLDDILISLSKIITKYRTNKKVKVNIRGLKSFDFLNYQDGRKLMDSLLKKEGAEINKNLHCKPRNEMVTMFANGDVSLCYHCENKDFVIGNLNKNSFEEIWANRFSNQIFQPRNLNDLICKECKYVSICKAGCPINAYMKYSTTKAPDGYCNYAKELSAKNKVKG
jgi:radical SAM protein with 4Fe4S-binding SPASM domain